MAVVSKHSGKEPSHLMLPCKMPLSGLPVASRTAKHIQYLKRKQFDSLETKVCLPGLVNHAKGVTSDPTRQVKSVLQSVKILGTRSV